ncbi:MAG: hypothetical protein ACFFB3_17320, partial [Candidatus Hodarchaeota archaeon]
SLGRRRMQLKYRKSIGSRLCSTRKGGPLLEEGILIGIGLFAFLILASIVTDIISWLSGNVSQAGNALEKLLGG